MTDLGVGGARVVVPRDTSRSVLYLRANSTAGLIKMPPLARNLVDTNAVAVLGDWINSLPGPAFYSAGYFTNGQFWLQLSGVAGRTYLLQGSTNLVNWITLNTNLAPTNVFNLKDPGASNFPQRFYRAIEQ